MKPKLLLIAFMLFSSICFAQNIEVRGKVNEAASGMPIPGVTVAVKNSQLGTVTDIDGNFMLSVPSGSVLVFSTIGFQTYEESITESRTLTISLQEDTQKLDEVVVIGYGTQRRREVTGAVSVVSTEVIENLRPIKIEQALQGTVSGVNVTSQSGAPGAGLNIRIRGIATNGNAAPLILVDGIIADMAFSDLNFNDIESITVLKDAQAAIYGTAGANGVILVTSKKGKKNMKPVFSYNNYFGFQETSRKLPLLNATEYALLLNERYANGGQALPFPDASNLGEGTDWQDEVFRKGAPMSQHDFSVQGGSEKTTYMLSGQHFEQDGIVGNSDKSHFERNNLRAAMTADVTDRFKINSNVIYTWLNRNSFNENGLGSVLFNAINTPSIYSPFTSTGDFTQLPISSSPGNPGGTLGNEIINPLAQIANTFQEYKLRRFFGNIGLDWEIVDNLTFTSRFGYNTQDADERVFNKQVSYGGKVFDNVRSTVNQNAFNNNDFTFDAYFNYKKSFAETHNFALTLGTTIFKTWGNGLYATGFDVPNNSWDFAYVELTTGTPPNKNVGSYVYDDRRTSYFARLQYDFKGRYLLSGMIRRDNSNRFGSDFRSAWFPSVTGGWIITDESFFPENKVLTFAKLRASYGLMGNDLIGSYLYQSRLSGEGTYVFDGQLVNGVAPGVLPTYDVRWEEAQKFDVGLDLRLFNDKLEITADYFHDKRADLLIPGIPVTAITGIAGPGAGYPTLNAGDVVNKGFELGLNYKGKSGDFGYNINYNVSFINNEVTYIKDNNILQGGAFGVGQPAITRMEVGQPLGYFYGYEMDGIFQTQADVEAHPSQFAVGGVDAQPGDIRYKDTNGDGVINVNDKTNIGDPIPDATMGINIALNYKGFDFVAYGFASIGNDMVRNYERTSTDVQRMNYTLDRWTGPGTSNSVPRVTTGATGNNVFSSYFVEDASYFRIQNVQLGYTINSDLTKKAWIDKVRIYVGANNLYTFTKYMGYDPGASNGDPLSSGIDYGFYPVPRTYLVGLNLNF
ncbi:MAG: SusC/RagA family TonB-linked outer membrane protein [Flavobacterium sp.]